MRAERARPPRRPADPARGPARAGRGRDGGSRRVRRRRAGDRGTADAVGVAEQQPVLEPPLPVRRPRAAPGARRVSLPALMRERFDGGAITRLRRQAVTDAYERWEVTYPAAGHHRVRRPAASARAGPFPASCSRTATSSPRRTSPVKVWPASRTPWRGRASWCCTPTTAATPRATPGGARARDPPRVHPGRAARRRLAQAAARGRPRPGRRCWGRSMGGGLVLNALVVQPDAVRSAVVHASVSSSFVENLEEFTVPTGPRPPAGSRPAPAAGPRTRRSNRGLSSRTYLDRVAVPVQVHHGTADDTCPVRWSRRTHRLLRAAARRGPPALPGEQHTPSCRSGRC